MTRSAGGRAPFIPDKPAPAGLTRAEILRATALELAIKAAPHLLPTHLDRVNGAQLTAEAEKIEQWLKEAK